MYKSFHRHNTILNKEDIHWQIDRFDKLRNYLSTRCAIILSSNALIVGFLFLVVREYLTLIDNLFLQLLLIFSSVLFFFSVFFAVHGIANVWMKSKRLYKSSKKRLLYHPRDTIEEFNSIESFENFIMSVGDEQLLEYATRELFTNIKLYHKRYQLLRLSIRLFLFGLALNIILLSIILPNLIN